MTMMHLHACTGLIVTAPEHDRGDRVRIVVKRASDDFELNLFGLPEDVADALLEALGPKAPPDFRDDFDETDRRPYRVPRDPDAREEWEP